MGLGMETISQELYEIDPYRTALHKDWNEREELDKRRNSFSPAKPFVEAIENNGKFIAVVGVARYNAERALTQAEGNLFDVDTQLTVWADAAMYDGDIELFKASVKQHAVKSRAADPDQYRTLKGYVDANYNDAHQQSAMGCIQKYPPYYASSAYYDSSGKPTTQYLMGDSKDSLAVSSSSKQANKQTSKQANKQTQYQKIIPTKMVPITFRKKKPLIKKLMIKQTSFIGD